MTDPKDQSATVVDLATPTADLAAMFTSKPGVLTLEEELTLLSVKRPPNSAYFRVHPEFVWSAALLQDPHDDRTMYLVSPEVAHHLIDDVKPKRFVLCKTSDGIYYLWPIRDCPASDADNWTTSAIRVVGRAQKEWVRVTASKKGSQYTITPSQTDRGDPEWPEWATDIAYIIGLGWREEERISEIDHPVIQHYLGRPASSGD